MSDATSSDPNPGNRMGVRFSDEEPTEDFEWVFRTIEGDVEGYPSTQADYQRFKALYGVPLGQWRPRGEGKATR